MLPAPRRAPEAAAALRPRGPSPAWLAWGLCAGLLAATHLSHLSLCRVPPGAAVALPWLPVAALRLLSLGHSAALSDVYVLRAVQHFGDTHQHAAGYPQLAPLVERAQALAPRSLVPYLLAGTAMTLPGMSAQRAMRLLAAGAQMRPDSWVVPFYWGATALFLADDRAQALQAFRRAAAHPQAPAHLPALIARLRAQMAEAAP